MHQNPSTRKVSTVYGTYHICEECWAAHPIPRRYLESDFINDSDGRPCECENVTHSIKVTIAPFNPDGGEL